MLTTRREFTAAGLTQYPAGPELEQLQDRLVRDKEAGTGNNLTRAANEDQNANARGNDPDLVLDGVANELQPVDWAARRREYEDSTIDWIRLRNYARRVAAELSARTEGEVPAPHVLSSRYWTQKRTGRGIEFIDEARYLYILDPDGELTVEYSSWEEICERGTSYRPAAGNVRRGSFGDSDVMLFDFAPHYYQRRDGDLFVSTNRDPSKKLLVHAKGVGLLNALNQLIQST